MGQLAVRFAAMLCVLLCATAASSPQTSSQSTSRQVVVPRIWDAAKLADWATPVAGLGVAPGFVSEKEYYATPVDNLRTYPVYHPKYQPSGYRDWLKKQGPHPLIEPEKLKSEADWIAAGRRVFEELDTAASRSDEPAVLDYFSDATAIDARRDAAHDAMTRDGVLLDYRWVVDNAGKLKISFSSCAGCHSRLMPDGSVLAGAPCNFDTADSPAAHILLKKLALTPKVSKGREFYEAFGVPWRADDVHAKFKEMTDEEFDHWDALENGAPPGTTAGRVNGGPLFTTRMADLIGLKDRRYLDATATHKNRGPEDIARYGILVEFADARVFGPHRMMADPLRVRPPDEAMYALGLFIYSLEPPKSPHPLDELARSGQKVFEAEGCAECHTPPVYTNNKLVAAPGFDPPDNAAEHGLDVSKRRVGTDPGLALKTRKGTGYYKIPSLRGLWYRGLYEHNGSVASLEDWFDPRRTRDDYQPSGWRGPGVKVRAVPGHKFGLDLSEEDKKALIAFLKTL